MDTDSSREDSKLKHQSNVERLGDVRVHDWYRFVFAYSDRLVEGLFEEFDVSADDLVLDPFVGTGTTALVAKRHGVDAIGVDTSPASVLSARVKTTWQVDLSTFRRRREKLLQRVEPAFREITTGGNRRLDQFGDASDESVSLDQYEFVVPEKTPKGWLSETPRKKMQVLRHHVAALPDDPVTDLFRLAMVAILPEDVGNVRFGPEATRDRSAEGDRDVEHILTQKLDRIESDLEEIQQVVRDGTINPGETEIVDGDARRINETLPERSRLLGSERHADGVDYVITSPPYPAEHDYTRNQRLELVWLGECDDNDDLQRIKRRNIRSHTKNIYVDDDEGERTDIREIDRVDDIIDQMETIIEEENITHGFGQNYPRVIEEYFGGMQHHLEAVYDLLAPGGVAAYVVADSG
ncbi:MAG: DNA methylase, partial [halophilic archaeon J07HB67]